MKKGAGRLAMVAAITALLTCRFSYRPSGMTQVLLMVWILVAVIAVVVGLVQVARKFKDAGLQLLCAIAGCVIALPLGARVGSWIRDADFKNRRMALYRGIVDRFERGDVPLAGGDAIILRPPEIDEDLAYLVRVRRDESGALTAWFLWGVGMPVKHTWYVYSQVGNSETDQNDSPSYRRLDANWSVGHD
jgi:hypothetical protein